MCMSHTRITISERLISIHFLSTIVLRQNIVFSYTQVHTAEVCYDSFNSFQNKKKPIFKRPIYEPANTLSNNSYCVVSAQNGRLGTPKGGFVAEGIQLTDFKPPPVDYPVIIENTDK